MSAIQEANVRATHPLARLLAPAEPIAPDDPSWDRDREVPGAAVRCLPGVGDRELIGADGWRLYARPAAAASGGRELVRFTRAGADLRCVRADDGTVVVPFGLADAHTGYAHELYATAHHRRRLGAGPLNAFYRVKGAIPRAVQLAARRALIRWQGRPSFPAWPFDASLAELLRFWIRCELVARDERSLRFRWFWPDRARAALILTHDVESAAGLRNAVRIADLEEDRGLRSSFNIVADEYPIDWGVVAELAARGFELGVHGVHHDRSMFASRANFEAQRPDLERMADRLGAAGFRSPATHRVHDWLAELPVDYDCTVPMSDPYEPQPGGCCSPWPYFLGNVVELPWTVPQDHTTFTLLGESTIGLWMDQLDAIERTAGLVQCLSHPDPGYLGDRDKRALYVQFLDAVAERSGLWRALPRDVSAWWRARDRSSAPPAPGEAGRAEIDDAGHLSLHPEPQAPYENQPPAAVRTTPIDR